MFYGLLAGMKTTSRKFVIECVSAAKRVDYTMPNDSLQNGIKGVKCKK